MRFRECLIFIGLVCKCIRCPPDRSWRSRYLQGVAADGLPLLSSLLHQRSRSLLPFKSIFGLGIFCLEFRRWVRFRRRLRISLRSWWLKWLWFWYLFVFVPLFWGCRTKHQCLSFSRGLRPWWWRCTSTTHRHLGFLSARHRRSCIWWLFGLRCNLRNGWSIQLCFPIRCSSLMTLSLPLKLLPLFWAVCNRLFRIFHSHLQVNIVSFGWFFHCLFHRRWWQLCSIWSLFWFSLSLQTQEASIFVVSTSYFWKIMLLPLFCHSIMMKT